MEFLITILVIIAVLVVVAMQSVRIVNEYARLVIFRFGRTGPDLVKGPGLVFLLPFIDRPVRTDLREQFIEVPSQTTITRDNAPINVDFLIYWRISDPLRIGVPIRSPNWVSLNPSSCLIRMPMIEKIVQTAKQMVKERVESQSARP